MRRPARPHTARRLAKGFMLIEVLVSVLLFSVGVLALIGLQANMNQAQGAAKDRTNAAYMANELVGMMWSDVTNLARYEGAGCASYARCKAWQDKVAQDLPNAQATVTMDALNPGDVTVEIQWTPVEGDPHKYTTKTTISLNT